MSFSPECKAFIQQLLEPNVETRMKIDEAARHRWVKKTGMRMKTHPLGAIEPKIHREMYKQISELCGMTITDVAAEIKADPFGAVAGIYNIKAHLHQMHAAPHDLLWSATNQEPRPATPPEYKPKPEGTNIRPLFQQLKQQPINPKPQETASKTVQTEKSTGSVRSSGYGKPVFKVYENGDGQGPRLPIIDEHGNVEAVRSPYVRKVSLENERQRLNSCPVKIGDKRTEFYRKAGDGLPSWRASGVNAPPRILLQNKATSIKRASLGNIVSPNSSTNSQCKSERAMP
ncbi:hypothetical protein O3G_MSEX000174, partial [Manduca sexta]